MKHKKLLGLGALILAVVVLLGVFFLTRPDAAAGSKNITITVIHKDESEKVFQLSTDQEYLGPALVEGKVVEDNRSDYGLYILTADGETADEGNQEWWCVTKGGAEVTLGADQQPIYDGECYELTLMVGW